MGAWDIDPAGVQGVVTATERVAGEFDAQKLALETDLRGASAQCSSELVAGALAGFAAAQAPGIRFVFTRTGACLTAAVTATNHYVAGDQAMAANAQAAATAAPDPRTAMPRGSGGRVPR